MGDDDRFNVEDFGLASLEGGDVEIIGNGTVAIVGTGVLAAGAAAVVFAGVIAVIDRDDLRSVLRR